MRLLACLTALLLLLAGSGCQTRRRPDPVTLVPEEPSTDLTQVLPPNQPSPPPPSPPPLVSTPFPERPYIRVHVAGAVVRPGLYPLPREARVGDAVEAAGGPMPDADLDRLNLADFLRDGDQVRVPRRAPAPPELPFSPPGRSPRGVPMPEPPPLPPEVGGVYSGRVPSQSAPSPAPARSRRTERPIGVVNLNTATVEELQALPGIGPVLAQRIVEHRTTRGPFQRPEELIEVKGIGPRTFERLRPYVTVR